MEEVAQNQPPSTVCGIQNVVAQLEDDDQDSFTEKAFEQLGKLVAKWPWLFLLFSVCLAGFSSFGFMYIRLENRLRDGYTPANARSIYETSVYNEFFGKGNSIPLLMTVLIEAKDKGSMIREEHLNETIDVAEFLLKNFTVAAKGADSPETFTLFDLCKPNCDGNEIFQIFRDGVVLQRNFIRQHKQRYLRIKMDYPFGVLRHINIQFATHFFGVTTWPNDGKTRATNMKYVGTLVLIFRSEVGSKEKQDLVKRWHRAVVTHTQQESNSLLDLMAYSQTIVSDEADRSSQRTTPYFALGFVMMTSFVSASLIGTTIYAGEKINNGKVITGVGAVIAPVVSVTTTFGLMSLCGLRTNSIMLITPFLVMAIGVDDAFLMMNSWHHVLHNPSKSHSVEKIIMFVFKVYRNDELFEDSGPSILITSLTTCLAFGIGVATPTPEIQLFCLTAALAMGFCFVYQITIFGALISLASRIPSEKSDKELNKKSKKSELQQCVKTAQQFYCRLLCQRWMQLIIGLLTLLLLSASVYGVLTLQAKLDIARLLPQDSPLQASYRAMTALVYNDYHPVTVLVNRPTDLSDPQQYGQLMAMVQEFEHLNYSLGQRLYWVCTFRNRHNNPAHGQLLTETVYETYVNERWDDPRGFKRILGFDVSTLSSTAVPSKANNGTNLQYLQEFFNNVAYKRWERTVQWSVKNNTPIVEKFAFSCAYHGTSSFDVRIRLMQQWRVIADKYGMFNTTVYEDNGPFYDLIVSLKGATIQAMLITLAVMSVVCLLFIPGIVSVVCASLAVASICLGATGFMSYWGENLDPAVMAGLLMTIGLSVDFTAHTCYHFFRVSTSDTGGRLEATLDAVGLPLLQAGLSTLLCVLPLTLLKGQYAPEIFFKTIVLVVSLGLLHGLLILPAMLAALPQRLTKRDCGRGIPNLFC